MSRSVDKVQSVLLSVLSRVVQSHRVGFDGDAPLPLEVHRVQQLRLHFPVGDRPRCLQQPVGECCLPMVDMGNDAEVTDKFGIHGGSLGAQPETLADWAELRRWVTARVRSGCRNSAVPATRILAPALTQDRAVSSPIPPSTVMSTS